jgi:hypothetical protein
MIEAALYRTANLHPFGSGQAKGAALVGFPWAEDDAPRATEGLTLRLVKPAPGES